MPKAIIRMSGLLFIRPYKRNFAVMQAKADFFSDFYLEGLSRVGLRYNKARPIA